MRLTDGGYNEQQYNLIQMRHMANLIAKELPAIIALTGADAVAVTGKSGISMAFAARMVADFDLIVVRKRGENSHGSSIEGKDGQRISKYLILDDFVSSGNTVRNIVGALDEYAEGQFYGVPRAPSHAQCVGVVEYKKYAAECDGRFVYVTDTEKVPRFGLRERERLQAKPEQWPARATSLKQFVEFYGGTPMELAA